jgi:hypothetical protein
MYALGLFCHGVKPDYAFIATVERLSENRLIMARLNAGKSSGFRLVTQFPSATTSLSSQLPPALRMSSWML